MPTPHKKPQAATVTQTSSKPITIGKTASIVVTLAFGLFLIFGAGFAPAALHDMAHDARHSIAFPCH